MTVTHTPGILRFADLDALPGMQFTTSPAVLQTLPLAPTSRSRVTGAFVAADRADANETPVWVSYFDNPDSQRAPYVRAGFPQQKRSNEHGQRLQDQAGRPKAGTGKV